MVKILSVRTGDTYGPLALFEQGTMRIGTRTAGYMARLRPISNSRLPQMSQWTCAGKCNYIIMTLRRHCEIIVTYLNKTGCHS